VVNGWERVDYFKPSAEFHPSLGFHFDEAHPVIGAEVAHLSEHVGLCEVNGFNRIEITGADRHSFVDRMICGRHSRVPGRVRLAYLLNDHGMIKAEATLANLPGDRIWYGSAAMSELHDMDWLQSHLKPGEDVQLRSLTNDQTILVLAGPQARAVLAACSRGDWSAQAFPWLSVRECFVGVAPATVMAVSFSGELAYEIHVPNSALYAAYLALRQAGEPLGLGLFGARAVESMRMEKGYLHWKADLLTEFDPFETGLDRFVDMTKAYFVGKQALARRQAQGPARVLVSLAVDRSDAPARPGASVMQNGEVVGTVTSGDWGHRTGRNIAYAYVVPHLAAIGTDLAIDILGDLTPAQVAPRCIYDAGNTRVRG
jgi:dimethylglycine dehydrogenase